MSTPLIRRGHPEWAPAPVRIVHLGLGAFFRAHQAWYTAHAADAHDWGIAAFSGHSTDLANRLSHQDGLYTLTTRGPDTDSVEVVPNVVAAHPGSDTEAWRAQIASPLVSIITMTVTEAAYVPGPHSVAARLVDGLARRRAADGGPVTVVPCDNVADNGSMLHALLRADAARRGDGLAEWIDDSVVVAATVVDRITPRPTPADVQIAASRGWIDGAPVVTEPFSEWVLAGGFAADHPDWVSAGATLTDDLAPYARRKLHLLNGAHSLLAYAGLLRGHRDVAEASNDPVLAEAVGAWWDEAASTVAGDPAVLEDYRKALSQRFGHRRMHHRLAQIAIDGSVKLPVRVIAVARTERSAGRGGEAAAAIIGAWVAYVRQVGGDLVDARRDAVLTAVSGSLPDATRRSVELLEPELAADATFVGAVADAAGYWSDRRAQ